ncbi:MAG: DNA-binding response regulator, partial [Bacteroidia bacterium]
VIESCIKKGAKGYLHKNCTPDELKTSIEKVMSGQVFLSEETQKILLGLKAVPSAVNTLAEPLTDKEIEVLVLVCEGLTSREIGERLFISPRTVETRKNNLMQKFGVQSTGKLVAAALKSKIIK